MKKYRFILIKGSNKYVKVWPFRDLEEAEAIGNGFARRGFWFVKITRAWTT